MGDRANVVIREGAEHVFIYSHWGGSDIFAMARRALAKQWRWDDPSYLVRIVYDEIVKGNEGTETGFGIWPSRPDNEHPVLVLDCATKQVTFENDSLDLVLAGPWPFDAFVAMTDFDLERAEKKAARAPGKVRS